MPGSDIAQALFGCSQTLGLVRDLLCHYCDSVDPIVPVGNTDVEQTVDECRLVAKEVVSELARALLTLKGMAEASRS